MEGSDRPSGERRDRSFLDRVDVMHIPVGVYVIAPDGRFRGCNEGVRLLLGLPLTGAVDASITDFYADPTTFDRLSRAAREADEKQGGFEKSIVELTVGDRTLFVEDFLKPIREGEGESEGEGTGVAESNGVTGYVGCMADITDEHLQAQQSDRLKHQVEELTFDIGRILHANTSTLLMVNQALVAASSALLPGQSQGDGSDTDALEAEIQEHTVELVALMKRLIDSGEPERRSRALPDETWQELRNAVSLLGEIEERVPVPEMRVPTIRLCAAGVARACRQIAPGWLPKEPVRDAGRVADEVLRLCAGIEVERTRTAVVQMDFTLRALRDFITSEVRSVEPTRRLSMESLVRDAVNQLADFARVSNVEIVWRERGRDLKVEGHERDLVRAIGNLLHNAIKYSWRRDRSGSPWVSIHTGSDEEGQTGFVEIQNWGVPVTRLEIREGLVYQMGYRGKWSTDRGRLGTGIGLTDTERVARSHAGEIHVESRPAHATDLSPDDRDYYERPFLTTVRLRLPLA